jgi:catechol 2,3-dioxygenase-like lactoylglutathione lyase family enzyme
MSASPTPLSIGHVGLFTRDFDGMIAFYRDVLGFVQTDRGERICFMSRDPGQHHQVVLCPGRPEGQAETVQQLSFRVETLDEVKSVHDRLVAAGVTKIDPCTHGNAWSVYFRDPENNRLEFYCDTPWHIPQPFRRPMDYSQPLDRVYAETKAICEAVPGFKPMQQYKTELAQRITAAQAAR